MAEQVTSVSTWRESGTFAHISDPGGHEYVTDAVLPGEPERARRGPRPVEMLLGVLGGCTGVDVVSMLRKMRLDVRIMKVQVVGERVDEHPKIYKRVHLTYEIETEPQNADQVLHALELSTTRYCAISAILASSATMTYTLRYAGHEYHGVIPRTNQDPGDERR